MAVKRVTIQFDDSVDTEKSTSLPSSLIGGEKTLSEKSQNTSTPAEQDDYGKVQAEDNVDDVVLKAETVGRTPADLVFAFINRPEFMATILFLASFIVFIGKIKALTDFWMPLVAGMLLNFVWFGISFARQAFPRDKK